MRSLLDFMHWAHNLLLGSFETFILLTGDNLNLRHWSFQICITKDASGISRLVVIFCKRLNYVRTDLINTSFLMLDGEARFYNKFITYLCLLFESLFAGIF